ncbi:xylulokinase [Microbacterium sp. ASV49]|uniref:FGGY family carbohydrate kinase n=1 Tax=Microbacterium candidum TaxID=3041922 RepID=A0ABT7N152_9MICO|nr:FGGY family carbohydrate kinase [Microbacterium sp. ASV49]MDL9980386.1 FGGY family carbohydrate kinase [Microbacterium sp. ASV49]
MRVDAGTDALTIGIDLGTSGVKAVALDAAGRPVARARRTYPTVREEPAAAEQEPAQWMSAIDEALQELAASAAPARWAAIGLSAMLPTLVALDDDLLAVGPAVTWEDGRAEQEAGDLSARFGEDELYRRTGQRVDAHYLLPMWVRRERRDLAVAGAKDWVHAQLTGALLTDPSTAAGFGAFDLEAGAWDDAILTAAGSPRVPRVAPSGTTTPLLPEVAERWGCAAGIPVVLGAADSVLGAYGLGALGRTGAVAAIAGTSTVLLAAASDPVRDPLGRWLVTPALDGFGLEMDLMTTGSALQWLATLTGTDVTALVAEAAASDPEACLVVLPYLGPGEQGALWDPRLAGAMSGLTLQTTRGDLARGILAGIVLEMRRCLGVLAEATGRPHAPVVLSGAGGRADFFRQDLADATGRPIVFDDAEHDHSAVGAARFAAQTVSGTVLDATPGRRTSTPDPARADYWAARFERHEAARLAQTPVKERI